MTIPVRSSPPSVDRGFLDTYPKVLDSFFLANPREKSFNASRTGPHGPAGRQPGFRDPGAGNFRPDSRREAGLRLSKHKIEYLSDKILKMIQEHEEIQWVAPEELGALDLSPGLVAIIESMGLLSHL